MNIFIVDQDPTIAAQSLCDKHVVKMVLETAQIMSTIRGGPYKPTHANHPCVLWAAASKANYDWLAEHGLELCREYTRRYHREHKSQAVIIPLANHCGYPVVGMSPFVQCMPDEYRGDDPVAAYRRYYHSKAAFAVWAHSPTPDWWNPQ